MSFDLHINWRGPLSSCNYDCDYCPFAKHVSPREELAADQAALERFVDWCRGPEARARRLSILFTPWGEALIRPYYPPALVELSRLAHVVAVAIQTNLSSRLAPLAEAERATLGLWTTFHPSQTTLERFVERCAELDAMAIRYSVGVVGLREHFELIEALRARLQPEVYLWINAYKSAGPGYYRDGERERLAAIDPLFELNAIRHPSRGQSCAAGRSALFVRGDGTVSRCHFVDRPLGNLYQVPLAQLLGEQPCPQQTCGCFIGYVQLDRLDLRRRFGAGLAARMLART
ncbi:MAG TPA: STM4011 family radical SAM protein [Enhygromyxa sp.]|nr:STM4011 family radical SAM protein [Enhygromyxa sp.]